MYSHNLVILLSVDDKIKNGETVARKYEELYGDFLGEQ
jgi:hypothetical protein